MQEKPKQWKINKINDLLNTFDSGTLSSIYKALLSIKEEDKQWTTINSK